MGSRVPFSGYDENGVWIVAEQDEHGNILGVSWRPTEGSYISLGFDADGDEHILGAKRNLNHSADPMCGCNPDAYNTENPYGKPPTPGVWVWYHHAFESELADARPAGDT